MKNKISRENLDGVLFAGMKQAIFAKIREYRFARWIVKGNILKKLKIYLNCAFVMKMKISISLMG